MKFLFIILTLSLSGTFVRAEEGRRGASFNEVLAVIKFDPLADGPQEERELQSYMSGQMPKYAMNLQSVFARGVAALKGDSDRTLQDKSDYLRRLPKLMHPNGVCVWGKWRGLGHGTGAFASGRRMLFIGRFSVGMEETESDFDRSFGLAGKLFPTTEKNKLVATENFFGVDVLLGSPQKQVLAAVTTNEPEVGVNAGLMPFFFKLVSVLRSADEAPGFRPVKNIARMLSSREKKEGTQASGPRWLRYSANEGHVLNNEKDFRAEVLQALLDNRKLYYRVDGSDITKDRHAEGWVPMAEIEITGGKVSYGCDRRLHFAHPRNE